MREIISRHGNESRAVALRKTDRRCGVVDLLSHFTLFILDDNLKCIFRLGDKNLPFLVYGLFTSVYIIGSGILISVTVLLSDKY